MHVITLITRRILPLFLLLLPVHVVFGQLTAGFTASATSGCAPLVVAFTNTTTPASGTTYVWNMGNGSGPITLTDPGTSYIASGTYTVTLTATNGSASSTFSRVITIYPDPVVNFTTSDTAACPGAPVTFTSTTTAGVAGPVTYLWSSGDGFTSTTMPYVHPFGFSGYFNITLNATNSAGCAASLTKTAYVHVLPRPTAGFSGSPLVICQHSGNVTFTPSATGAAPFTYRWTFGDGSTVSTATNPTHFYASPGNFNVKQVVTDVRGCVDSTTRTGYVYISALTAAFTAPASACYNTPVSFTNTSTTHLTRSWSYGDGNTGTSFNGLNTYMSRSTFNVRLIVADGYCSDTVTHSVNIPAAPISFTITPAQPCPAPITASFASSVPAGSTVTWVFGDNTTGTGSAPTHTYTANKWDSVRMIVTSSIGCRDTSLQLYRINDLILNGSNSSFSGGCIPLSTSFSANVQTTVPPTPGPVTTLRYTYPYSGTYTWNFGDGSPTATGVTTTHSYTATGNYNAVVTFTSTNGCTKSLTLPGMAGTPPVATFSVTPLRQCYHDNAITFTRTVVSGTPDKYYWHFHDDSYLDFEDNFGGATRTFQHHFTRPGTFYVGLWAAFKGCWSFYASPSAVVIDSPMSVIEGNVVCSLARTYQFINSSIGSSTHVWLFGDGTTSTLANPLHTYPSDTEYFPKLATYNASSGCRDTAESYVDFTKLTVNVSASDTAICRNDYTYLTSNVTAGYALSYRWLVAGSMSNPIGTFTADTFHSIGVYTVKLALIDHNSCPDTVTKNNYILVAKPDIYFKATPPVTCYPNAILFTDSIICLTGTFLTSRIWSFGDGDVVSTSSTSVSHNYLNQGAYVTTEMVTDNVGCKDTLTQAIAGMYKAIASFHTANIHACTSTNVQFTNSSNSTNGTFLWSFGDGATSTLVNPSHYYTNPGTYTPKMVMTETHGCMDSVSYPNYVTVTRPDAAFTMDDSIAVCPPLTVHFTNASTGGTSNFWDLGNGTFSVSANPSNIYNIPALDTVSLIVTDVWGCKDTAIAHVKVFGYAGAFNFSIDSGCAPLSVFFSADLNGISSLASNVTWDFSDGITSTAGLIDTITHTYTELGSYLPKLIITDHLGCSSASAALDTIRTSRVQAGFTASADPACIHSPQTFVDTSSSARSYIISRLWSYNGTTSTVPSPTFTYTTTGIHVDTLRVTDAWGCSGMATKSISVYDIPGITVTDTVICIGGNGTLSHTVPGGVWSSGTPGVATVGSTGIVTGAGIGTTTITYSVSGCYTVKTITVSGAVSPITGTLRICLGGSATLSNAVAAGTWSSADPGIATITPGGLVSGVNGGIVIISYSKNGCLSTATVTVDPGPAVIVGPDTICTGTSALYTSASGGGTWAGSNATVATVGSGSGLVYGNTTGTVVITYTISGCYVTDTVSVESALPSITGIRRMCTGDSTTLSIAATGGMWISDAPGVAPVSAAGIVNGIAAGTATITYSANSCISTAMVTVDPGPAAIVGPDSICAGTSALYASTTGSGTWAGSNATVATVGSGSGLVYGNTGGTVVITYTISGCFVTTTVTVAAALPPITGITRLCTGDSTTLSNAAPGGIWTSGAPGIAPAGITGVVNGVAAGIATITYAAGICTVTTTVTVDANPLPVSGPARICAGDPATYTDLSAGGIWSSSHPAIADIGTATGIVNGISAGAATITYNVSGCFSTLPMTVVVTPPITGVLHVCTGNTTVLGNATTGGIWSTGTPAIADISSTGIVTGIAAGIAPVTYNAGGCIATVTVTVDQSPAPLSTPPVLCIGETVTLTNSVSGGTWSSSDPSTATVGPVTGLVTGISTGVATITYFLSGCYTTTTVTVGPTALPAPITGTSLLCVGATTMLSNASPGGTWTSSAPGVAGIIASGGIVTAVAPGTSVITYAIGNCTTAITVTVDPGAPAITGLPLICAGVSTLYTTSMPGGTWSSSNPAVAIAGPGSAVLTGVVTGISGGVAVITYTVTSACGTSYATKTITIDPFPDAGIAAGSANLCTGTTTTLTGTVAGGTWSSGNTAVATIGTGTGMVNGITSGLAPMTYTATNSCGTAFTVKTVTVDAFPDAGIITGPSSVCTGAAITLTNPAAGGVWSSSGLSIAPGGPGAVIVTGILAGPNVVSYSISNSCGTVSATKMVTVNSMPAAIAGDSKLCVGTTTTFTNVVPGGTWSSGYPGIAIADPLTGLVTGVSPGVAAITYSTGGRCKTTKTVTVYPAPDAGAITGPPRICIGSRATYQFTAPLGNWTVSGNDRIVYILPGIDPLTLYGAAAGTAVISYSVITGCGTAAVNKTITITPAPAITGKLSICPRETTILTSGATGATWQSNDTAVAAVAAGVVTGQKAGVAVISCFVDSGCSAVAMVTVNPVPDAGVINGPSPLCPGVLAVFTNNINHGKWRTGNPTIATIDSNTGFLSTLVPGTTVITYTVPMNIYGCDDSASFPVTVKANALVIGASIAGMKCHGDNDASISINMTGGSAPFEYLWSTGKTDSAITGVLAGTYTVKVTELSTQCARTQNVVVPEPEEISVTADVTNDYCNTKEGRIRIHVSGGAAPYSYLWPDNSTDNELTGLFTGNYRVVVTDKNDCNKEFIATVADSCANFVIYTGLSPNGDGFNDTWIIDGIQQYPLNTVQVFNKLGDLVFEQHNYNSDWYGQGKDGGLLPDGTYIYLVKLNTPNGPGGKDTFTGALMIKR